MSMADSRSAWLSEPADEVDSGAERWRQLARQLRADLSNIILMSEEDLQVQRGRPRGRPGASVHWMAPNRISKSDPRASFSCCSFGCGAKVKFLLEGESLFH